MTSEYLNKYLSVVLHLSNVWTLCCSLKFARCSMSARPLKWQSLLWMNPKWQAMFSPYIWSCRYEYRPKDLSGAFKLLWILSCFTYWGAVPPPSQWKVSTPYIPHHLLLLPQVISRYHIFSPITCYTPSYPYQACNNGITGQERLIQTRLIQSST